jgi:uncharacterized protein YyaL (SSP411 family)
LAGQNTLFRAAHETALAELFELSVDEVRAILARSRAVLLEARRGRPLPHRDDKIVTAWNALMIAALARGARVLGRTDLLEAARGAAGFLRANLWDGARLFRSFRGKSSGVPGFAVDYAFLVSALIELHAADGDPSHLAWALELQKSLDAEHWDAERVGYVTKAVLDGEPLLVLREDYDGAEPSAGHVAAENLLKLAVLAGRPEFATRAEAILRAGAKTATAQPFSVPVWLGAFDLLDRGVMKIEVRGEPEAALAEILRMSYLPRAVFTRSDGPGEVVVCDGHVCRPPVRDAAEFQIP